MFLDASVIVAILAREPGYEEILNHLATEAGPFQISPLVRFEATVSLARKKAIGIDKDMRTTGEQMMQAKAAVNELIAALGAEQLPISPEIGELALGAAMTYGKAVGHPADLNFGDCFAYGCAKATGARLIYKGNDFALTDLA